MRAFLDSTKHHALAVLGFAFVVIFGFFAGKPK